MKISIDISDEKLEEIGLDLQTMQRMKAEIIDLGDRNPTSVTGSKYPKGILLYVEEK